MRTACFLFLATTWAALTHGLSYTAPELALCPLRRGVFEDSALSPLGERVARDGVFISWRGTGEGVRPWTGSAHHSSFSQRLPSGGGAPRSSMQGAERAFARQRVLDAQGTQSATARGPTRGHTAAASPQANRSKQPLNGRQRSLPGEGTKLRQPGSDHSGGAARGGLIQNKTVNNGVPVRTPSVAWPAAPIVNNARHRSPNPAAVGGSFSSHSSSAGTINGTGKSGKLSPRSGGP
jgi:hypothetical protein